MRVLFNRLHVSGGENVVLSESNGIEKPGVIKMNIKENASVFNVLLNLMRFKKDCHVYAIAICSDHTHGVFKDSEIKNLTWLCYGDKAYELFCAGIDETPVILSQTLKKLSIPIDVVISVSPLIGRLSQMAISWKKNVASVVRYETGFDGKTAHRVDWMRIKKPGYEGMIAASMIDSANVFLGKSQMRSLLSEYGKILSAHEMRKIVDRSFVVRNPIDLDELDKIRNETPFTRTVGSFYRLTDLKGTKDVIELYQKMYSSKLIDDAMITTAQAIDLKKELPNLPSKFTAKGSCDRSEYLRIAQNSKVAVYNSKLESDPTVPIELGYLGVVPVLVNRPWATDSFKDWPLFYDNMNEAASLVAAVLESEESYRKYADMIKKMIIERSSANEAADHFWSVVEKELCIVDKFYGVEQSVIDDLIAGKIMSVVSSMDRIEWHRVLKINTPVFAGEPMMHHGDMYRLLLRAGWKDNYEECVPVLTKG